MVPAAVRRPVQFLRRLAIQLIREPRTSALGARMALWIVLVSVAARMTSFPTTLQLLSLGIGHPGRRPPSAEPEYLATTIDRVLRLDLPVFKPRCWKRALVLYRYLTSRGIACRVNFGVRRDEQGTLAGHAWLERNGRAYLEPDGDVDTYVVTFSLPASAATAVVHTPSRTA